MHAHADPASRPGPAVRRAVVAETLRRHGPVYLRDHAVTPAQAKALRAAIACRTAALGGHLEVCQDCGGATPAYNSCRDRHCPTCQGSQASAWLAGRIERVLPAHYFHVVFTLPAPLRAIALANPRFVYGLLFDAASGGGLSLDDQTWVPCPDAFLFPVKVMGALFRGKFMAGLVAAYKAGDLHFAGTSAGLAHPVAFATMRAELYATDWVVFAKRPFGGPKQVLAYLSRYTHRVAISDARIRFADDDRVVIKTRENRTATMAPAEFIRRLLLHVLPRQFRKIRHYGLLAPANVNTRLVAARVALQALGATLDRDSTPAAGEDTSADAIVVARPSLPRCPHCGSERLCREPLPAAARGPPRVAQ